MARNCPYYKGNMCVPPKGDSHSCSYNGSDFNNCFAYVGAEAWSRTGSMSAGAKAQDRLMGKFDQLPKKPNLCEKCGNGWFEYDNFWKEYICKECGWVSKNEKQVSTEIHSINMESSSVAKKKPMSDLKAGCLAPIIFIIGILILVSLYQVIAAMLK